MHSDIWFLSRRSGVQIPKHGIEVGLASLRKLLANGMLRVSQKRGCKTSLPVRGVGIGTPETKAAPPTRHAGLRGACFLLVQSLGRFAGNL